MPPRQEQQLTHFLCIPLITPSSKPQLQQSLSSFRASITNKSTPQNPDGIPERAVRPTGTLHLTLGVMSLLTGEKVDRALDLLRSLDLREMLSYGAGKEPEVGEGGKKKEKQSVAGEDRKEVRVTLRGLASMHDAAKTSILYSSPVDDDGCLLSFCQKLKDTFTAANILVPDARPLLLHATVLNTIYVPGVRGRGKEGHGKNRAKLTVDAREILEDYEEFEWMRDVKIERVAICKMGTKQKEDGEEEYVVEGEVEMP